MKINRPPVGVESIAGKKCRARRYRYEDIVSEGAGWITKTGSVETLSCMFLTSFWRKKKAITNNLTKCFKVRSSSSNLKRLLLMILEQSSHSIFMVFALVQF